VAGLSTDRKGRQSALPHAERVDPLVPPDATQVATRKVDMTITAHTTAAPGTAEGTDARGGRERLRSLALRLRDDTGAATAEFAVVTMASVGFAGLLVAILRSEAVRGLLMDLIKHALAAAG
jgi:hypothetical protein